MHVQLFTPYDKQRQILDEYFASEALFGVVVAPRGSGKTLLGINMMLGWLLNQTDSKGGWISPVYNQAKSVYDQIVIKAQPVIKSSSRQDLLIKFVNGSTLKFLSTDNADNIRGFRFTHVTIDEMAFQKELAIDQVVLPTLNPSGRKCLMISTPKSRNHFFRWFNKGMAGDANIQSFKIPLTECPYVKDSLIETARQSLPPDLFRQEYMAEFVDTANDVFIGVDKAATITQWDTKRQDAYIGIDTGLSDDMSVLTVMSPTGRVLNMVERNNDNISNIAKFFMDCLSQYNVIGGYIETNGIGRAMYDLIYPSFRKVRKWNTSQKTKEEMVRKLITDIETLTVELPTMELNGQLHSEFTTYTYKMSPNGKLSFTHEKGTHDDHLDALMLANIARNQFVGKKMTITTSSFGR